MIIFDFYRFGLKCSEIYFYDGSSIFNRDIVYCNQSLKLVDNVREYQEFLTLVSSLTEDESVIQSKIHADCRYKIRRAEREGVTGSYFGLNSSIPSEKLEEFVSFHNGFAKTKGLCLLGSKDLKNYNKNNKLILSQGALDNNLLVYHLYIHDGTRIRLLKSVSQYRNSNDNKLKLLIGMANRWLHWSDMSTFKNSGFKEYDWGGISHDSEFENITNFKRSFGGLEQLNYNFKTAITYKAKIYFFLTNIFKRITLRDRKKRMYLCCFRLDDITPAMKKEKFDELRELFDKKNIKPLLGVVPDNRDETLNICPEYDDFWYLIKELKANGWMVAQHGYTHVYCTQKSGILKANNFSELAGLSFSEQSEKIRKGKEILEEKGIFTDVFMAPGHTFDKNTLRALKVNGFKYVTDGYSKYPYFYEGLKFIPCMHDTPRKTKGIITVSIHLNHISEKALGSILEFIEKNQESIIDFDEALNISEKNTYGLVYQRLYIVKRAIKEFLKRQIKRYED